MTSDKRRGSSSWSIGPPRFRMPRSRRWRCTAASRRKPRLHWRASCAAVDSPWDVALEVSRTMTSRAISRSVARKWGSRSGHRMLARGPEHYLAGADWAVPSASLPRPVRKAMLRRPRPCSRGARRICYRRCRLRRGSHPRSGRQQRRPSRRSEPSFARDKTPARKAPLQARAFHRMLLQQAEAVPPDRNIPRNDSTKLPRHSHHRGHRAVAAISVHTT